jgi:hypothetical protein
MVSQVFFINSLKLSNLKWIELRTTGAEWVKYYLTACDIPTPDFFRGGAIPPPRVVCLFFIEQRNQLAARIHCEANSDGRSTRKAAVAIEDSVPSFEIVANLKQSGCAVEVRNFLLVVVLLQICTKMIRFGGSSLTL